MTLTLDPPIAEATQPSRQRAAEDGIGSGTFALAAVTSIAAGAVHATAAGSHGGQRQAVLAFGATALLQLGLGAFALTSRRRAAGLALAVVNAAALVGWGLSKRDGIGFVDGLEDASGVRWADGVAAGLAALTVVAVALAARRTWRVRASRALVQVLAVPIAAITLTAMVAAASPAHHGTGASAGAGGAASAAPVPPKPFIPGQPIDLGGVEGVTPEQQAAAENLLAATNYYLPQFADPAVAESLGWRSIGDGATGEEHFVNPATFTDGKILDPTAPESLVYDVVDGKRTLAAAMFMLEPGKTLDDVPEVGGKLMQWHIHDNLCFNAAGVVAGLRAPGGSCPQGLAPGGETPMIHVWIRSNKCGPFAALQGIAGGTIAEGEARLCDAAHGH